MLLIGIMYRNSVVTLFNCQVGLQMATMSFKQSKTNQLQIVKTDLCYCVL